LKRSVLEQLLAKSSALPVKSAAAGDEVAPGFVYVARPDLHLGVDIVRNHRVPT
jgi:chemotaxis response regulator CheB